MTQKEFTLKNEFKNVGKLKHFEDLDSPEEEHFGVKWKINIQQNGEHLAMYLYTNFNENQQVYADFTMTTFSKNKEKTHSVSLSNVYEGGEPPLLNWGLPSFMIWKTMEKEYLNRGNLEVEFMLK
ncbi:hypothetical protein B9Z55_020852 [Caenorhabditis nigoni]|uniref:MATH domain-containing protein n=1 Tax=Caenorhabditis nigoni TaxID=1611254 RepID=A0A2G5TPE5_9PELO|nr:hypothetical protein B9Z55_020852 [Caenorhabditis nigoni]